MEKATEFIKQHIVALLVLAVVVAVPFGVVSAKYTTTKNVSSSIKVSVSLGYTIDKATMQTALKSLAASNPTSINFVTGNDAHIAGLTSVSDGIQAEGSGKIGIFTSGTDIYIAPMNDDKTPASNDSVMNTQTDCSYFLSNSETGLGGSVTSINCSNLDTSKATNLSYMFESCTALTTLSISTLDTAAATNMAAMFSGCSALETLDLTNVSTASATSATNMFSGCSVLQTVTLGANFAFVGSDGCLPAQTDTTAIPKCDGRWYDADDKLFGYTPTELAALARTQVKTYTAVAPDFITIDGNGGDQSWPFGDVLNDECYEATSVQFVKSSAVPSTATRVDSGGVQASGQTGEIGVYYDETSTIAYIAPVDNDNAIIRLPAYANYFMSTQATVSLDEVTSIIFSNVDTSQVERFDGFITDAPKLKYVDLSRLNLSKATSMYIMFAWNSKLETVDLGDFNTTSCGNFANMFQQCYALKTIYVGSGYNTGSSYVNSSGMFDSCNSLVGGEGTTYDSSHTDGTYARIDDPTNGKPGYFTKKSS